MRAFIIFFILIFSTLFSYIEPQTEGSRQDGKTKYVVLSVTNSTSDWIYIPYNTDKTAVSLHFNSNQARVEYTLAPITINSYTNTTDFFIWSKGTTNISCVDSLLIPAWGLRVVALTNEVRAYFIFWIKQ